jgi:hypothetical protein
MMLNFSYACFPPSDLLLAHYIDSRIPMASDDTQQLMLMLHNSDPDIVQSAAVIMGTVIANGGNERKNTH